MPQQALTTYTNMMKLLWNTLKVKRYISWTCLKFSTHGQPFIFRNVGNIVIHSFIFEVQNSRKACPLHVLCMSLHGILSSHCVKGKMGKHSEHGNYFELHSWYNTNLEVLVSKHQKAAAVQNKKLGCRTYQERELREIRCPGKTSCVSKFWGKSINWERLWNIFIIDKLNDSNSHHAMWQGKEHECIQTTGAPWLSESNAKHHLRASSHSEELPLSSAIFYPFHTSVMMSITQFLSPVLHCEATIVKILHSLSAPSFS